MKLYQLGQLFALPLQSAIRAQSLAVQETISFIEQFGLEEGVAKTFHFKAERMIEKRDLDKERETPVTLFKIQPFEVSIPILALVSPPNMNIQEMNVEFGVNIVEPKTEPIKSSMIPSKVLGSSLASSLSLFTSTSQSNPTTMKVTMKITREIPEGMARLGDVLTDLLSGKSPEVKKEKITKIGLDIQRIVGIGPERAKILKSKGILSVEDFIKATEKTEAIKDLANATGVSPKRISEWRKNVKLFIKEKK